MPAQPAPLPDAHDARRVLTFHLAGADYALDLHWVREIRNPEPPTPLPGQAAGILGVNNLRGDMVPLLCLRTRLHMPAAPTPPSAVVVVQLPQGLVGLLVDRVEDVRELPAATLRTPPLRHGSGSAHLLALCGTPHQPLQLLNPLSLLPQAQGMH